MKGYDTAFQIVILGHAIWLMEGGVGNKRWVVGGKYECMVPLINIKMLEATAAGII
jgi:hypothetical protein